jgi:TorA maturation chaperone TorD
MDESIKNAPDHLGVELSFLSELCEREASALENGDEDGAKATRELAASFMKDHPGRWATDFADEMLKFATTDFYRGIAYLLKSFVTEGKLLFA